MEITSDYLQKGFDYTQLGYSYLPGSQPLNEKIVLRNLKVHIVGSLETFEKNKFDSKRADAPQGLPRKHEIWVVGKQLKGKIIINQLVLGHELKHLLHQNRSDVVDPCFLEVLEACFVSGRALEDCR